MEQTRVSVTRACLRRWWVILLVVVIALVVSAILTSRQAPRYRTSAHLVVTPNSRVESNSDVLRSLETLERRTVVATFARLAAARDTRDAAAARLDLEPRELSPYYVSAAVLPNTNMIKIDVSGPDRERVAEVANAAAAVMRRRGRRLYRIYSLQLVGQAPPAYRPYHPDPSRNLMAAGLIGLFLGLVSACAVDAVLSERTPDSPRR
jgi:capsular polysaccharide biosynthesis protein